MLHILRDPISERMNGAGTVRELPWTGHVWKEADRDLMGVGERVGNAVAIAFIVFFAFLLLYLQGRGYIFSAEFSDVDAVLLYGLVLFGIVPNLVRAVTGRRNLGRLFDIIDGLLFLVVGAYFLNKFPFHFDDLYTVLPDDVQGLFSWFDDAIFRLLLQIALVITAISVVYQSILYVLVRNELRERGSGGSG